MTDGLPALERQVARDLRLVAYPDLEWVPPREADGTRVLDVLVVGAGQGGLAIAAQLLRERVTNFLVVDGAEAGSEGIWTGYARMHTLRTAKSVTGPDLGLPSLTFQAWFEAQHGGAAYETLHKIAKQDWHAYLCWLRHVLDIPVQNRTRFTGVVPDGSLLRITLERPQGTVSVLARKLVLANGIDASGRWWMPPEIAGLPRSVRAHSADAIDFPGLRGKRIAVLGAGASAFDNAAVALEHGAATVTLLCRRQELQRVQPYKIIANAGFLRHLGAMPDAMRWPMMRYLLNVREALTLETWNRATCHPGFVLQTGAPVQEASLLDGVVQLRTPNGSLAADFVICGTGLQIDLSLRPELALLSQHAALWRDRYTPPASERDERIGSYPYLGRGMQFIERKPGAAPWLANVHCFNFGATLSMGPSGSSISGMKFAVPRLVQALTEDLFREDFAMHRQTILDYQLPEFPLTLARDRAAG
ncbi:NAD(P)-binding domain-containing protein [Lichenicoccus sp.]|uniref:NAD(P)-binding domain-containing protein n=1 Tax=Lichenicoccus sp. TaxID=2781899 RepID=UPI003D14BC8B